MGFLKTIARSILSDEMEELDNYRNEEKITNSKKIKEDYYNKKYPENDVPYFRTDNQKTIQIDVRQFVNPNDFNLPIVSGTTDDEKALNCLRWIIQNIKYVPDKQQYGMGEYWAFPYQTLNNKKGDCEDGAILLASMMIKNGIPNWKIRVSAGNVLLNNQNAGHAYVTYYYEEGDRWVLLDWCYWPNQKEISDRIDYKFEELYKDIWFSFNDEYAFGFAADLRKAEGLLNG